MPRYNTEAEWKDPYEAIDDRRSAGRFAFRMQISIETAQGARRLVGPAIIRDVSQSGILVHTKHQLAEGDSVRVAIPTDTCPDEMGLVDMCLPKAFIGRANVVRTSPVGDKVTAAALQLDDLLAQNVEFNMFVQFLQTVTKALE